MNVQHSVELGQEQSPVPTRRDPRLHLHNLFQKIEVNQRKGESASANQRARVRELLRSIDRQGLRMSSMLVWKARMCGFF